MSIMWFVVIGLVGVVLFAYKDELYTKIKSFSIKHFPWMKVLQPQINKSPEELSRKLDRDTALSALSEENAELKKSIEKYRRQVKELEKKVKYPTEIKLYEALSKEKDEKIRRFINNSFVITRNDTRVMSKDGGILGKLIALYIGPYGKSMVSLKDSASGKIIHLGPDDMSVMYPSNFIRSIKNGVLPVNYDDQYELIPDAYIGRVA